MGVDVMLCSNIDHNFEQNTSDIILDREFLAYILSYKELAKIVQIEDLSPIFEPESHIFPDWEAFFVDCCKKKTLDEFRDAVYKNKLPGNLELYKNSINNLLAKLSLSNELQMEVDCFFWKQYGRYSEGDYISILLEGLDQCLRFALNVEAKGGTNVYYHIE